MVYKENCVFCKISKKEISSNIIYEDDEFIAILDGRPNTKGMTLVMTKEHYDSYVFDLDDEVYKKLMLITKKVSKILEKGLNVKRVGLIFEGQGVNHIHAKLYPLHGIDTSQFGELEGKDVYFEKYPGYMTSLVGPKRSVEELKEVRDEILNNQ